MLRHFLILWSLIFLLVLDLCNGDRKPYDPSTVINVYPSLASLHQGKKVLDMSSDSGSDYSDSRNPDCDYTQKGACSAASADHPIWMQKNVAKDIQAALKPAVAALSPKTEEYKNHKESKKQISKWKYMKSDIETTTHAVKAKVHPTVQPSFNSEKPYKLSQLHDDERNKVHSWSSFQDMLQLLSKRKH